MKDKDFFFGHIRKQPNGEMQKYAYHEGFQQLDPTSRQWIFSFGLNLVDVILKWILWPINSLGTWLWRGAREDSIRWKISSFLLGFE